MTGGNNHDGFSWSAVSRNRSNIPSKDQVSSKSASIVFDSIWPKTAVATEAQGYAKACLPEQIYNHSLRVYRYGHQIVTPHFPSWFTASFSETWALTRLFHDMPQHPRIVQPRTCPSNSKEASSL